MKKRDATPLLGQVLKKIAPRIGARVIMEPEWGIVGQVVYKSGRKRYFRYSSLDLNPLGASEIATDKDYAYFFMRRMGYPVIPGKTFFSDAWARAIGSPGRNIDAAYLFASRLGFPVIVKPNSRSHGVGVALVHTKREFYRSLREVFRLDRIALVQRPVHGKDYRVVVLDRQVISAYERIPLNVVGNGVATIHKLLLAKQKSFVAASRDTRIKIEDPRIMEKLKRKGLSLRSVPKKGERIFLLDNANLSAGGDSVDVTASMHPLFKKIAVQLTRDMGLRLCGVDLMIEGDICDAPKTYWVLEVNAAPGLDHYARSGKTQEKIVEKLYLQVLKRMEE
ncbi:MAG: cyanophycin synthetase [Candidatus Uhrbacteria bacterium]|nr:cyanophycin synthetase [Candidatus Uhrbacteria bacterium]